MNEPKQIPYVAFESMSVRYERIIKYLVTALIISVLLLFASNAIWVYEWTQYDYTGAQSTVDVDAGNGTANYIGNDGDINGENNCSETNSVETPKR